MDDPYGDSLPKDSSQDVNLKEPQNLTYVNNSWRITGFKQVGSNLV